LWLNKSIERQRIHEVNSTNHKEDLKKILLRQPQDAGGAFEDFLIFSDSRQCWPAVWAGQRSNTPGSLPEYLFPKSKKLN